MFSFHAGVPAVGEIVERAGDLGLPAVALTDTDRMSGLILHYLECRKAGIRPLLGVELTEPDPGEREPVRRRGGASGLPVPPHRARGAAGRTQCPKVLLLARNAEGYGDLCRIVTDRHLAAADFSFARAFAREWPNLFLLTADPGLLQLLAAGPNRGRLFGELVRNSAFTRARSAALAAAAGSLGLPLAASNDSFFLDPGDWQVHRVLTAVGLNSTLSRLRPGEAAPRAAVLASPARMEELFADCPEALANTGEIAAACDVELELDQWIMPRASVPPGHTPESRLAELAAAGLEANYGGRSAALRERARQLQAMELEVISRLGYASYFLIVKEIRDWANERFRGGYRRPADCTILRGSAANSITFYNIGVSDLDPIRYDLYFQRFLNEDRASPPDADLDFGWDERELVYDFMVDRWGAERVAVTGTTIHFRARAAFRETAKVFGYTDGQVTAILESRKTRTQRIEDGEIAMLWRLARRLEGKPRYMGQHPGGVLIANGPISRHVACEPSGGAKNRAVTQIDMHNGIDELGLIKFDILGNGSLSVLRDALAQLDEQGIADPGVWDLEKCCADPRVREIVRRGRTKGIFYIESPAQRRLNQKAQAETFEEITVTSSLVRPAGSAYTQLYVERERKRKTGIRDWEFVHPALEPILRETHDVCAFQEDVTKICHQVAGLSFKQADMIRKMMNSQHEGAPDSGAWRDTERAFLQGCRDHSGLSGEQARELWKRVSSFTGFSFCKSHSATYAQLSFQCAYLKAHFPAQFLAAVISNGHGFYHRDVYLNEARRWGVRVLPMDVNESGVRYRGRGALMRPGMMHLRGVREKALEALVAERRAGGRFRDLPDLAHRVPGLHKKEIERLVLVGALDGFGPTQPELLWQLDDVAAAARGGAASAAPLIDGLALRPPVPEGLRDYSLAEKCLNELELLGYMISGEILEILDMHPAAAGAVPAADIGRCAGRRIRLFGRRVTDRVHRVQRSGEAMMFLTIEDKSESADVVLWPDVFERCADVVAGPGPFEVRGRVTEDWGTFTVEADSIRAVAWSPNEVDFELASRKLAASVEGVRRYGDVETAAA